LGGELTHAVPRGAIIAKVAAPPQNRLNVAGGCRAIAAGVLARFAGVLA
jgi:hypothetical protein